MAPHGTVTANQSFYPWRKDYSKPPRSKRFREHHMMKGASIFSTMMSWSGLSIPWVSISLSVRHVSLSSASRQASSNPFGRTWLVGKREDCEWEHSAHDVVLLIPYMKCCPWYNLSILSSLFASQRSSLVLSVPLRLSVELPSRLQKEPKPLRKPA